MKRTWRDSRLLKELAFDNPFFSHLQIGIGKRFAIAFHPVLRDDQVRRAADKADSLMSKGDQMLGCIIGSLHIIRIDG